jgi:hypothetical protein
MVAGSIVMSIWGGGKKSTSALFLFSALNGMGLIIAGVKPSISTIAVGLSLSFFTLPIILGINQTIWQTSINPNVQGRVLSLFSTLTGLTLAFGNLSASPLADRIFEPILSDDGFLANSVGQLIETGQGRGIGFLMIIAGLFVLFTSVIFYSYNRLRKVDRD